MSDESTITTSALFSSLVPKPSADTGQPDALNDGTFQVASDTVAHSFSSVLASNIDAGSGSNETGDGSGHREQQLFNGVNGVNGVNATKEGTARTADALQDGAYSDQILRNVETNRAQSDRGNVLALSGETLPVQEIADASAETTLDSFSPELDAVDIQRLQADQVTNDSVGQEYGSINNLDAKLAEDAMASREDRLFEERDTDPAEIKLSGDLTGVSAIATPAQSSAPLSDPAGLRTQSGTASGAASQLSASAATSDTSAANQQDLLDKHSDTSGGASHDDQFSGSGLQDNANEGVFETRLAERTAAKFSVESEFAPDQFPAPSPSARSGEPTLNALGGGTASPLTTNATATLPASLHSATTTERSAANQQIAQQISSFISKGDGYAEINLSPPHLGKITVRIALQNDQASVLLTAPSPEIRELLEGSLPKLGALLSEAGLSLADGQVLDQGNNESASDTLDDQRSQELAADPHSQNKRALPHEPLMAALNHQRGIPLFEAYA